ncbi:MAG: chromosome partitioning protein [Gammaproteobacteria bacterium]|jgi:chromosome partitioning protein
MALTQQDLTEISSKSEFVLQPSPIRTTSAWEITSFVLPMSIGHFRRVLRDNPDLPQGVAEDTAANAPRWFTYQQVEQLRTYFKTQGRKAEPPRPNTAPLISLVHPYGRAGKSTAVLHLATAAALSGLKVLVIDADPAAVVTRALANTSDAGLGVLPLIARSYGGHLLRANQLRLDQGETPQPMEDAIARALGLSATDVIQHSRYPNIDLIAARRSLALADMKLGDWQGRARTWQPWRALHDVIQRDGLADTYNVIFCDTGAGVGPLNLAVAASSDVLVMPVPLGDPQAETSAAAGLHTLADGLNEIQTRENRTARAMGQTGMKLSWRGMHLLLNGEGTQTRPAAAQMRSRFGSAVLPDGLPEVPAVRTGEIAQFYDLPTRNLPRATYMPLRRDMDACWQGMLSHII